jgi:hypothetical protein
LPGFERLQWTLPIAVTFHNLEEAIWLPSWTAAHHAILPWQVSATSFRIGVGVLTVAAYVVTWLSLKLGRESVWTYLFVAYTFAMFFNVFVPHLPATILFKSYTPGVITAGIINLPITTLLLVRTLRDRIVASPAISAFVFGVPLGIATTAAVLFGSRLRL